MKAENKRVASIVGKMVKRYSNYHRQEGKFYTTGLLDVTNKYDHKPVLMRFKAYGALAERIINESKAGKHMIIYGTIEEELRRELEPKLGYVFYISLKEENGGKVHFI